MWVCALYVQPNKLVGTLINVSNLLQFEMVKWHRTFFFSSVCIEIHSIRCSIQIKGKIQFFLQHMDLFHVCRKSQIFQQIPNDFYLFVRKSVTFNKFSEFNKELFRIRREFASEWLPKKVFKREGLMIAGNFYGHLVESSIWRIHLFFCRNHQHQLTTY